MKRRKDSTTYYHPPYYAVSCSFCLGANSKPEFSKCIDVKKDLDKNGAVAAEN
jgi:hypothetical protein